MNLLLIHLGAVICVTHHVEDVMSLAEQVITLEAGTLAPAESPWGRSE